MIDSARDLLTLAHKSGITVSSRQNNEKPAMGDFWNPWKSKALSPSLSLSPSPSLCSPIALQVQTQEEDADAYSYTYTAPTSNPNHNPYPNHSSPCSDRSVVFEEMKDTQTQRGTLRLPFCSTPSPSPSPSPTGEGVSLVELRKTAQQQAERCSAYLESLDKLLARWPNPTRKYVTSPAQ